MTCVSITVSLFAKHGTPGKLDHKHFCVVSDLHAIAVRSGSYNGCFVKQRRCRLVSLA